MVKVLQVILLSVLLPLSVYTAIDSNQCDTESSSYCSIDAFTNIEDTGFKDERSPEAFGLLASERHPVKGNKQAITRTRNVRHLSGNFQKNQFFVVELLDYSRIAKEVTKPPVKSH